MVGAGELSGARADKEEKRATLRALMVIIPFVCRRLPPGSTDTSTWKKSGGVFNGGQCRYFETTPTQEIPINSFKYNFRFEQRKGVSYLIAKYLTICPVN